MKNVNISGKDMQENIPVASEGTSSEFSLRSYGELAKVFSQDIQ
jgi:hypothetical protein